MPYKNYFIIIFNLKNTYHLSLINIVKIIHFLTSLNLSMKSVIKNTTPLWFFYLFPSCILVVHFPLGRCSKDVFAEYHSRTLN